MKNKLLYILSLVLILSTSCEKVINVDIANADKKYVIDGEVSTSPSLNTYVKLSQTKNFSQDNSFIGVSGATVTIQENNGTIYTLTETSTGVYSNSMLKGVSGNNYKLNVSVNGNAFTSTSTIPGLVVLDSLTFDDFVFGSTVNKTVRPSYRDPLGIVNFYKFDQYKNGKKVNFIWAFDDDITDGRVVTRPFINPDGELKKGDTVKMVMQCVDANVYKFWYSLLESASGANQSGAPANPVTNINGGALGVFSAATYDEKTIILK